MAVLRGRLRLVALEAFFHVQVGAHHVQNLFERRQKSLGGSRRMAASPELIYTCSLLVDRFSSLHDARTRSLKLGPGRRHAGDERQHESQHGE